MSHVRRLQVSALRGREARSDTYGDTAETRQTTYGVRVLLLLPGVDGWARQLRFSLFFSSPGAGFTGDGAADGETGAGGTGDGAADCGIGGGEGGRGAGGAGGNENAR